MYNVLFVVTRSVFWEMQDSYLALWLTLDYLSDVIYITDMFVSARTGRSTLTHTHTHTHTHTALYLYHFISLVVSRLSSKGGFDCSIQVLAQRLHFTFEVKIS